MLLSKLWNRSKGPLKLLSATGMSLLIGLWSFDLQKLSPNSTLTSQTIFDLRVGLSILSLLILIFLMSFVVIYSLVISFREQSALTKELLDTVESIKKIVENNYTIHQRDSFSPNISKASDEEASRGFNLPTGALAGRLFDIHLKEISIFASIIREASLSFINNSGVSLSSPELLELFSELLIGHNKKIKIYHNSLVTDLFCHNSSTHSETMVEHFNKQADIETKLRCKELLSALKIKNSSTCSDMVFPQWKPIKKKEPEKHHYIEEDAS